MSAQLKKINFDRKGRHVLGKKLGEGAQGFIYSLKKDNGEDSEWCAKITAIAKPTKARRSVPEINQGALQYERLMYQSTFVRLQGDIIPRLPKASGETKSLEAYKYDEEAGYLYIVMERMQMPLMDAVKSLPVNANAVDLSAVAKRLLHIFKTFHESYKIITDVKTDNFMVAPGEGSVDERLRMVDLALLKDLYDTNGKHSANEGVDSLRGTPLYASLNAHNLQSPSRRDDMESLLYMLAELVIVVTAEHAEPKPLWYKSESFLPWSDGTSDKDIFQKKKQHVTDPSSELYKRMPADLAAMFFELFKECHGYAFKDAPKYDVFEKRFSKVVVRLGDNKRKAAPGNKRKAASQKAEASSPRRLRTSTRIRPSATSDESLEDPMEVDEVWPTENIDPQASISPSDLLEDRRFEAATLTVIQGPHKGEKWVVQEGGQEQYCIGSNPKSKNYLPLTLSKEKSILPKHAQIQLQLSKKKLLINFSDLSKGNTTINGDVKPKDFALFDHDRVQIGETIIQVSRAPRPTLK